MRGLRNRVVIALDESGVAGATVSGGPGSPLLRSFPRFPLAAAALAAGPVDPNVIRPAEVAQALREVAARLELGRGRVVLVLPAGLARTALVDLSGGVAARELARYRVAPGLPYPPEEALVDVL